MKMAWLGVGSSYLQADFQVDELLEAVGQAHQRPFGVGFGQPAQGKAAEALDLLDDP